MTTPTTHYAWGKPTPGSDTDTWGALLNVIFDEIDADLFEGLAAKQGLDGTLTSLSGLTISAGVYIRGTGADTFTVDTYAQAMANLAGAASTVEFVGTVRGRVARSSETTDTLTSASANKLVACSGGITLPNSVFTADDGILFDPGTSARTFTRGSGIAMYVNGVDSSSATLAAGKMGGAYWRSASVVVLSGGFS